MPNYEDLTLDGDQRGGRAVNGYVPVKPREHAVGCRRGTDPAGSNYGLDRERCERCRRLWQRLIEAGARPCAQPRGSRGAR